MLSEIISAAEFHPDPEARAQLRRWDAIRAETLRRLWSEPGTAELTREARNNRYDEIKKEVEKEI